MLEKVLVSNSLYIADHLGSDISIKKNLYSAGICELIFILYFDLPDNSKASFITETKALSSSSINVSKSALVK